MKVFAIFRTCIGLVDDTRGITIGNIIRLANFYFYFYNTPKAMVENFQVHLGIHMHGGAQTLAHVSLFNIGIQKMIC